MTLVLRRATAVAMLLLAGTLAGGCSNKKLNPIAAQNFLPVVRVTSAPIDTNAVCTPDPARSCYSLTLDWVGYDADGRVDHYVYAIDPPDDADTTWIVTNDNEKRLVFNAPSRSPNADSLLILRGFHVFVIAAVDNDGATGPRVNRAFFSFTKAPTVSITNPRPVKSAVRTLPPSIRITWQGLDEDGVFTTKPVRYKYLLLGPGNEFSVVPGGIATIFSSGGSAIRRYYAPEFRADQGWIATSGETTSVQFTDLVPGANYLFTVVGFDEAGAYSPVFLFDTNIIRFQVGFAAAFGPRITVFNESFFFQFPAAYNPANKVDIEVPAGIVTFNWFGTPPEGADIVGYRWMLDGDVFDERPRSDENTDLTHWSTQSASTISATIGPFTVAKDHFFYVEAEDNTGLKSLATVHFFIVVPTFSRSLLVVDDTRYEPDGFLGTGTRVNYGRPWPSAAELDTFMYAKGGVPWELTNPPLNSPPGVFHGYDFDTIGTRLGIANISTSLATLGAYRHVVWLLDFQSATFGNSGNVPIDPMSSLRYMTVPGHLNSLGAYIRMGGEAWLVGGGGAYATEIPFDDGANNTGGNIVFSFIGPKRELAPGRFMYDAAKWQSVIRVRTGIGIANTGNIVRSLGRFTSNPGVYATLPASFDKRLAGQDPLPPGRLAPQFYPTSYSCEFIDGDNPIVEAVNGDPIDFKIDGFDDATPAPMIARWPVRDTLNTIVTQGDVTNPGSTRAALHSLRVHTSGSGASLGDSVYHDFAETRDWSGLTALKFNLKQDQPASTVQWRVRVMDSRGGVATALVDPGVTNAFADISIPESAFLNDPSSTLMLDWVRVRSLQFEVAKDLAPGNSEFDNIEVFTETEGAVLDTLLAAKLSFGLTPPINATMTVYHGHDFIRPFVFTGFAPWIFRLGQCQQLFDFVLQRLWGLPKTTGSLVSSRPAPFISAHPLTRRPAVVLGGSGALLRQGANPGAILRRNGNP